MNSKLGWAMMLAVLSLAPISGSKSAYAALSAADFCNSPRLKAIVEAVLCKRDNCGEEGKLTDYSFACTQIDPTDVNRVGAFANRIDTGEDTRPAAFTRVNDHYPMLDALISLHLDPPPKLIELPPCECLATIEGKTKCGIEQCPPKKPAEVPAPPAPEEPASSKAQVPEQATTGTEGQVAMSGGGLCSLGFGDFSNQATTWIGLGLLNGIGLLGWRRWQS